MKGPDNPKCTREMSNGIRHPFRGIRYIEGMDTCFFVHCREVPQDNKVTYFRIIYDIQPQKKDTHRVHITVGGVKLT